MFRSTFILIFMLFVNHAAQDLSNIKEKTLYLFTWSNDFLFQTDCYYTNGFAFEFLGEWAKRNPINDILISVSKKTFEQAGFNIKQDIFTPQEKYDVEKQLSGDRPFAATLLLGFIKKSFSEKLRARIISEIQIGILGPLALGKETQDGIHDITPTSKRLNGWENQISSSFALQYSIDFYKTLMTNKWVDFSILTGGALGLPLTQADMGGELRIGFMNEIPKDFEMLSENKHLAYFFAETSLRVVGYNALLQGGLFSNSIYTIGKINNLVGSYKLGVISKYSFVKLEFATIFNTPEFPGALSHRWVYLTIQLGI